jgi:hypothetical protein
MLPFHLLGFLKKKTSFPQQQQQQQAQISAFEKNPT